MSLQEFVQVILIKVYKDTRIFKTDVRGLLIYNEYCSGPLKKGRFGSIKLCLLYLVLPDEEGKVCFLDSVYVCEQFDITSESPSDCRDPLSFITHEPAARPTVKTNICNEPPLFGRCVSS